MLPCSSTPWNPATTTTRPAARSLRTACSSISRMRALLKALSVRIRTWAPVYDRAGQPRFSRAILKSAIVTCSPVANNTSNSRGAGRGSILCAKPTSRSVSPLIADTTTITSWPRARPATALAADLQRHAVDQFARLHLLRRIGRDARDQAHFAVAHRREHHHRRTQFVLELIDGVAQRLGIGAVESRGQHLHAAHFLGL